ncbi:MAG: DUF1849 family protein [Gammaproteobacteria bacterium]|nr:DUF1849 family protein [Gammaproteobacteria bacterium]
MHRHRLLVAVPLLVVALAPIGEAQAAGLLSHRAVYSLTRAHSSQAMDVTGVKGRLEMTFEAACDGWRMEQFIGFQLYHPQGPGLEHLAQLSGWESVDGADYRFNTLSYVDREVQEKLGGVAHVEAHGKAGETTYSTPEPITRSLPPGTIFPARHLAELVAAAARGERHLARTVFDGSTMDSPYEIVAFIGEPREPSAQAPAGLEGLRSWPLRLAYFRVATKQPSPEFEMSAVLYENGVAGDMVYDYGDLAIDVKLAELERLPATECRQKD